jgi:hypothetical protein
LHVLSTPPAFVLSQDQTLRREFGRHRARCRPSIERPRIERNDSTTRLWHHRMALAPPGSLTVRFAFTRSPWAGSPQRSPALALSSCLLFSRSDSRSRARARKALVPLSLLGPGRFRPSEAGGQSNDRPQARQPERAQPPGFLPHRPVTWDRRLRGGRSDSIAPPGPDGRGGARISSPGGTARPGGNTIRARTHGGARGPPTHSGSWRLAAEPVRGPL